MAGYFELVGRVITEKGAWYKIVFLSLLQFALLLFHPKLLLSQTIMNPADVNIAGWIFYLLASLLASGFVIQLYSTRVKSDKSVLPEFDIPGMLLYSLKIVPLLLVWGVYSLIYCLFAGLCIYLSMLSSHNNVLVVALVFILPFLILQILAFPVLIAMYTKSFTFQGPMLNPFALFMIVSRAGIPMFLNLLAQFLLQVVLVVLLYAFIIILGISGFQTLLEGFSAATLPLILASCLLFFAFVYFLYVIQFAYIARTCDIAKEYFGDTDFMDGEYYDLEENEPKSQLSDEELFAGYMRNKPEEDDFHY